MAPQTLKAPSGPRAGRNNSSTRLSQRGGNRKGRQSDKDGDLNMDLGSTIKGRGRGINKRRDDIHGHPGSSTRSRGIDPASVQKAVLRTMGTKETPPKGPRASSRLAKPTKADRTTGGLDQIRIHGLKDSKAASNPGGGVKELLDFLERKATPPNSTSKDAVRIRKSRNEGDAVIISVRPEDASNIIRLNNFTFAGANLRIELYKQSPPHTDITTNVTTNVTTNATPSSEAAELTEHLKSILARRYNQELRLLDFSALGQDQELVDLGMFRSRSNPWKFFFALLKVVDTVFTTEQQKTEAIVSVSLANNTLPDLGVVSALSQVFPCLKNLDLSGNNFRSINDLDKWRNKFRQLEHLILTGNPLERGDPTFMAELMNWFPNLRTIGTTQVRSEQQLAIAKRPRIPFAIRRPRFADEGDIAKNFILQFFSGYDTDRHSLLKNYYDKRSQFSMNVNTSAPRDPSGSHRSASWRKYIDSSRNLCMITSKKARINRLFRGLRDEVWQNSIATVWKSLPATKHPDLITEGEKWCLECDRVNGVPEGQTPGGVNGLILTLHGEFTETDDSRRPIKRSFDRVFILGPGNGPGGIHVLNDMLTLRPYSGYEAFKPDCERSPAEQVAYMQPPKRTLRKLGLPPDFGYYDAGKTEETIIKERMALILTQRTKMTIHFAGMCLEQSSWDLEAAEQAFEGAKATLPKEAFHQAF